MAIYLKSAADIAALINGPAYTALTLDRKNEIAAHYEQMLPSVWEAALDVMLTTYSLDEQNFARALFTDAPPAAGSAPPPTTSTPTTSVDERRGLLPIAQGADSVAIAFSPAFPAVPLPPDCEVLKAAPGDDNIFVVGIQNLTINGCVALLSAAAPNGNYQLGFRTTTAS